MSAIGTKRTCVSALHTSAFGGKEDIGVVGRTATDSQGTTTLYVADGRKAGTVTQREEMMLMQWMPFAAALLCW